MAMLVSQFKCVVALRSNTTLPLFSHAKGNFNRACYKRTYHVCLKAKRNGVNADPRNTFPKLEWMKLGPLVTGHRCLSHAQGNGGASDKLSRQSSSVSPEINTTNSLDSSSGLSSPETDGVSKPVSQVSVEANNNVDSVVDFIPEPPTAPVQEIVNAVQDVVGEPTFASLGLGGWTPVGVVQNCMEYLHIDCGLPWWGAIALGTCVVRILIFPLVVIAQRNAAKMNNHLPQLQILQLKMTEARQTGNQLEAARLGQEMMIFMKEKNLNPLKNMVVPLAQAPLFISFFLGLRKMAACPVESLKDGGLFWFTDLTVPDQYFLLPILTSATLWVTIEVGTDSARLNSSNMQIMKYVLRAMPVIILPFTVNFPGAILCYWVSSNFISLGQVAFLRIPAVREYFKIEKLVNHQAENLPIKPKGFTKGFKDSWENMKITNTLEERQRYDEMQFLKAGRGPIQKTYKRDPTKENIIAAKDAKPSSTKIKS
ncbi:mitochondrial inner membrane protein OXA1L [Ischnura elegans]|uniref:mitochondrial inner membrane protein OXA1L n=1 Tax=Ischnura elegans TaxID=197161 RepID=UPI001ED86BDA|nr:mitochondrial inner membrane protein OXA1L [Ischnura elegans]